MGQQKNEFNIVQYLTEEALHLLVRQGETPENAAKEANAFILRLLHRIGGGQIYIPKGTAKQVEEKRTALKAALKQSRESVYDFARKNQISTVCAYLLLKKTSQKPTTKRAVDPALNDMSIEIARSLVITGASLQDAVPVAKDFSAVVFARLQGKSVYFPTAEKLKIREKAEKIWKMYQEQTSLQEIADRFGFTLQHISQLIRERAKREGIATPAEKKAHPLAYIHRRILSVAEDYRAENQQAFEKLQGLAEQINDVKKSLQTRGKNSA